MLFNEGVDCKDDENAEAKTLFRLRLLEWCQRLWTELMGLCSNGTTKQVQTDDKCCIVFVFIDVYFTDE